MDSISGFFTMPEADDLNQTGRLTLLYESPTGFSQVWRGEKAGRFLCYKSLKPEFRGDLLYEGLLRKEFDICFKLDHPGVCRCYDFRRHPEIGNAIEMEWIDGVTLNEYASGSHPSTWEKRRILEEICDALEYTHRHQVFHRDLKPSNILITHNGAYPKIIDFGLSDTSYHAVLKAAAGTEGYAAPELAAGDVSAGNARVDIYSLGKIIAEILPARKRVIRKCTASEPEKRYSNANKVKKALRNGWVRPVLAAVLLAIVVAAVPFAKETDEAAGQRPAAEANVPGGAANVTEEAINATETAGVEPPAGQSDVLQAEKPLQNTTGGNGPDKAVSSSGPSATGKNTGKPSTKDYGQKEAPAKSDEPIGHEELDALFRQATQIIREGE